jgi:hypothetical protein
MTIKTNSNDRLPPTNAKFTIFSQTLYSRFVAWSRWHTTVDKRINEWGREIDVNPAKNNETQQRKGTQDRSMDRFEGMTNKNLGIRKTPQTVVEFPFDKSR